jgi:uncharacterized protein (DUF924 family)
MYNEIIRFWFEEIQESQWWVKDPDFDRLIFDRYSELHRSAAICELYEWRSTPEGCLAEIILLDQFSRNMYRNSPQAFASDSLALCLAQEAIRASIDQSLDPTQRSFLYMPFMHSESKKIHEVAVALYERNGIQSNLKFELKHKAIIDRFGRYPHRNQILGRESTAEEIEFLKLPGSAF